MTAHAIAAIGVFGGTSVNAGGLEDSFVAIVPAAAAFFYGRQLLLFMIFAFIITVVETFVRMRWAAQVMCFVTVFLTMAGQESLPASAPALALASLLQAWLLIWLYRKFGLLAVMISTIASHATLSS